MAITPAMIKAAAVRAIKMGSLKKSFSGGSRNIVGFTAEEVYKTMVPSAIHVDKYHHDFVLRGKKIDIKARICRAYPKPDFDFTIEQTMAEQDVDFFVFFGVHESLDHAWCLGYISKQLFYEQTEAVNKGDPMPQGGNYLAGGRRIYVRQMAEYKGE